MRILFLGTAIPFPPIGGGNMRTYNLLKALASRHDVTLVAFTYEDNLDRWISLPFPLRLIGFIPNRFFRLFRRKALKHPSPPFPIRVVGVPWEWPWLYKPMKFGTPFFSRSATKKLNDEIDEPWFVSCAKSAAMEQTLRSITQEVFDLVFIEHTNMARFLSVLPMNVPKILDLHNAHTLVAQRDVEGSSGDAKVQAERED